MVEDNSGNIYTDQAQPPTVAQAPTVASMRKGGRAGTTRSKLVRPSSPIQKLAVQFQSHLHFPDPMPLYVVMGMIAGNMMTGAPIWMMLVGSSGGGKTALLKSLLKLPNLRAVSEIKGGAAFLSGVKHKDRAADASGGLLKELGERGCLAFMDFTSVLSKSREGLTEILGILRELYDKTYSRDIGGEGGRKLYHDGTVFMVAGVTHQIDRQHEVNSFMGERCIYFRLPYTDGYQESMKVANSLEPDRYNEERQEQVIAMFDDLGMSFENPVLRRELNISEVQRIVLLAQLAAVTRTAIAREGQYKTVIDVPQIEVCTRLTGELAQLYLGMEMIGVDTEDRWAALSKVTLDCMPLSRRVVFQALVDGEAARGVSAIVQKVRISESVVRRVMEDLELLDIAKVRTVGNGGVPSTGGWVLTNWTEERLERAGVRVKEEEEVEDESE